MSSPAVPTSRGDVHTLPTDTIPALDSSPMASVLIPSLLAAHAHSASPTILQETLSSPREDHLVATAAPLPFRESSSAVTSVAVDSARPVEVQGPGLVAAVATEEIGVPAETAPLQREEEEEEEPVAAPIARAPQQAPQKPVFSLFLTPEQRKKKMEAAATAATTSTHIKRNRKPKNKGFSPLSGSASTPASSLAPTAVPSLATTTTPPVDPKSIVDPNISKTGETHPFFQEVKVSQQLFAAAATASGSSGTGTTTIEGNMESEHDGAKTMAPRRRHYTSKPQESPFPMQHRQFHGSETINAINGVVARLCGLDTSSSSSSISSSPSSISASVPAAAESLLKSSRRCTSNRGSFGWYSLRSTPDLGITAPSQYLNSSNGNCNRNGNIVSNSSSNSDSSNSMMMMMMAMTQKRPRGKDCWTHWGADRDQKWREWSERPYRLQKPSECERQLVVGPKSQRTRYMRLGDVDVDFNGKADGEEEDQQQQLVFESCKRLAANQPLWQQTWASTLLTTATLTAAAGGTTGLTSGSAEAHSEILKSGGELWTQKYRPMQGADVLGNHANTEYLTQWLKGLEVSGWTLAPEESSSTASGTLSAAVVTAVGGGGGGGGGTGSAGIGGFGLTRKASDIMGAAKKRRKRPRRRGASGLDDFIIYDDADDFEDPYGYVSEEDDGCFAAPRPLSTFSRLAHHGPSPEGDVVSSNVISGISHSGRIKTLPKLFEIKSNTILLSGPIGGCKSAAVYACAEESGYEVFEVSPGMRRTGKEVLGLVGEMAENHHVHVIAGKMDSSKEDIQGIMNRKSHDSSASTPAPAPAQTSLMYSFFQQGPRGRKSGPEWKQQQSKNEDESMDECSDVDVDGIEDHNSLAAQSNDVNTPQRTRSSSSSEEERDGSLAFHEDALSDLYSLLATTNPRQSLILLEEVDILFEEDKGFWASIVTLLSKSRRPVVMTCNDTSKIPAATLRFQEHLEFTRPGLRELHQYLTCICKIEGYICSSENILGLIKYCQYDVRRCLIQLQYDAGLVRTKHILSRSSSTSSSSSGSFGNSRSGSPRTTPDSSAGSKTLGNGGAATGVGTAGVGSHGRKKPQRLLRISAKGIIPATAPTMSQERSSNVKSPLQELERLEVQMQYAETMSLWDSELRMKPGRVIQCYELDQFKASKDDIVGQHFSIYKRPSGAEHLLLDQEIASLVEEGCASLYVNLANQYGMTEPQVFEDAVKKDDPARDLAENFVPLNEVMSRNLQRMRPALEQSLSLHGLRFNLDTTFSTYAPLLRSMVQAEAMTTIVPSGKRTMRSGPRRHLDMLSESERDLMLSTSFSVQH